MRPLVIGALPLFWYTTVAVRVVPEACAPTGVHELVIIGSGPVAAGAFVEGGGTASRVRACGAGSIESAASSSAGATSGARSLWTSSLTSSPSAPPCSSGVLVPGSSSVDPPVSSVPLSPPIPPAASSPPWAAGASTPPGDSWANAVAEDPSPNGTAKPTSTASASAVA